MDEVERRLMEAVARLEKQYEEQRQQIRAFEDASLEHLNQQLGKLTPALDDMRRRLEQVEKQQQVLLAQQKLLVELCEQCVSE
jgi:uncharacterized protein involved in exopolysaccharide biosynthesis